MFDNMVSQLSVSPHTNKCFYVTKEQFEEFKRECVFHKLKDEPLGTAFCKKFNLSNGVLSILDGDLALGHINTFYVK